MELSYWQSRWNKQKTGWHMDRVYPPLLRNRGRLTPDPGPDAASGAAPRVLVPLCGKSLDLAWFLEQGWQVAGVDVSEVAARTFFEEQQRSYRIDEQGAFRVYRSGDLAFWVGDFMKLEPGRLFTPDLVYDKAALIALPPDRRAGYVQQLRRFCGPATRIFLNCFEYEESEMDGPPFSVRTEEVEALYGDGYERTLLERHALLEELPGFRQRGLASYLTEKVYLLNPR